MLRHGEVNVAMLSIEPDLRCNSIYNITRSDRCCALSSPPTPSLRVLWNPALFPPTPSSEREDGALLAQIDVCHLTVRGAKKYQRIYHMIVTAARENQARCQDEICPSGVAKSVVLEDSCGWNGRRSCEEESLRNLAAIT